MMGDIAEVEQNDRLFAGLEEFEVIAHLYNHCQYTEDAYHSFAGKDHYCGSVLFIRLVLTSLRGISINSNTREG
jgi:hypothetical protein